METATVVFLVVGAVGACVLLVSLAFGEALHLGHVDVDGPFSTPAVAGFVGAFGFVGAIGASVAGPVGGVVAGLAGGLPVGWVAVRLSRALSGMRTDVTLTGGHLVGTTGVVVSAVPADGYGEVRLAVAGQHLKLSARSEHPLAAGTAVFVIDAPSDTSVVVVETTRI